MLSIEVFMQFYKLQVNKEKQYKDKACSHPTRIKLSIIPLTNIVDLTYKYHHVTLYL